MRLAIITAALLALSPMNLFSGTLRFPTGDAARFTFVIPEKWNTETDKDGTVEAYPTDEDLYLAAWEVEDMADVQSPADSLAHLLRDCAKQIKLSGAPEKMKVGEFSAMLFSGSGQDADDGEAIRFLALIVHTGPQDASVIYLQADADASNEEFGILRGILTSLKAL